MTFFVMRTRSFTRNGLAMKSSTPSTSEPNPSSLSARPPPTNSVPAKIATLAPGLFQEKHVRDFDAFIEGFAHVVDREGCGSNGNQSFHLDAGLGRRRNVGAYLHAIFAQASGHINVGEGQGMTKRYPLSGAFGGSNSGDASDFQRISLGIF